MSQPPCTVLLTEEVVTGPDLDRLLALHPAGEDPAWTYRVVVHLGEGGSRLAEVVDHVVLGELREAVDGARGDDPGPREQAEEAAGVLAATLAALREHGRDAQGAVVGQDPVEVVADLVREGGAQEVVVVSRPRFVEDTLRRDWASRVRGAVDVPVLHVYGGTTTVG